MQCQKCIILTTLEKWDIILIGTGVYMAVQYNQKSDTWSPNVRVCNDTFGVYLAMIYYGVIFIQFVIIWSLKSILLLSSSSLIDKVWYKFTYHVFLLDNGSVCDIFFFIANLQLLIIFTVSLNDQSWKP